MELKFKSHDMLSDEAACRQVARFEFARFVQGTKDFTCQIETALQDVLSATTISRAQTEPNRMQHPQAT